MSRSHLGGRSHGCWARYLRQQPAAIASGCPAGGTTLYLCRKDKAQYIKCYMDLVELSADYDTYCMLGEAFMQIQVGGTERSKCKWTAL